MRAVVHKDRQPKLAGADQHDRQHISQRIGKRGDDRD